MKILVIIVTYNAMQWIDRCFGSVREWDVFVVDNGSTDGTQQYLKEHFPHVILKQSNSNLGFGKANNIGLQYALDNAYDFVYLMNQDAWVMPGTIATMAEVMGKHPEYGVLSPMQMQADMKHFDWDFGWGICVWKYSHEMLEGWFHRINEAEVYEVHFVNAAHWLISMDCLCKVGGFSTAFPHYGEDNNYINRVFFNGLKLGVVCGTTAVHDRADRPVTKDKRNYMECYVEPLILLSTITSEKNKSFRSELIKRIARCVSVAGITITIKYWIKILRQLKKIKSARENSRRKCAFLTCRTNLC